MINNQNHTWQATSELGDYFSRLGGAARPWNMAESEIQLYVACKLIEFNDNSFDARNYLDIAFVHAAAPVIDKVDLCIRKVSLPLAELIPFVLDFYEYADFKLKENDKTRRWRSFGEHLRSRTG